MNTFLILDFRFVIGDWRLILITSKSLGNAPTTKRKIVNLQSSIFNQQ